MSVLISNDGGIQVPIDADEIVQVIQAVLSAEEVERECSVSVSIVDEDEIQSLNAMWRQIDAPTDVLSFECDSPFGDEVPDGEVVCRAMSFYVLPSSPRRRPTSTPRLPMSSALCWSMACCICLGTTTSTPMMRRVWRIESL